MSPTEIIAMGWLLLGLPFAAFACSQWWFWRDEYKRLQLHWIETMKYSERPFIRLLPAETRENVISVDFRGHP